VTRVGALTSSKSCRVALYLLPVQVSHADALFPFGGVTYKLQYFVTHTVSEHTVDGEHYDMVSFL
jgi:carbonic anhydrase